MDFDQALECIQLALDAILANRPQRVVPAEEMPPALRVVAEKVNTLARDIAQVNNAIAALSKGKTDIDIPPRTNILASNIKQLHSSLWHLTWQTQQIADGDYAQTVDFLGDFSAAFNQMTAQLKEREAKLNANSIIMRSVFDHIENLFIVSAADRNLAYLVNACARRTFGVAEEVMDLRPAMESSSFLFNLLHTTNTDEPHLEILDDSTQKWYYVVISELTWHGEDALLFYCTDMTLQKRREASLEHDALTDPLTGIPNRRMMDLQIEHTWPHYQRLRLPVSVILVDIDFFKHYNDTYGHQQGDVCLRAVSMCMRNSFSRATDVLARCGGEEFLIMLPNTDGNAAYLIAEKLRRKIEELVIPYEAQALQTHVTCSFGVATCIPPPAISPQLLIQKADEALYRAKAEGRNRVVSVLNAL